MRKIKNGPLTYIMLKDATLKYLYLSQLLPIQAIPIYYLYENKGNR